MNFIERIELTAESYSDKVAVDDGFHVITYSQLKSQTDIIAHILMKQGNGEFVAVILPRTYWFTIAIIGIIKAGKTYIPLNPVNPAGYNLDILREAGVKSLITTSQIWERIAHYAEYDIKPLFVDRLDSYSISGYEKCDYDGSKAAALYFTSGTTGIRKGVLHSLDSLMFLCDSVWRYHFEDGSMNPMFAVVTDLDFMTSVIGLFTPLMHGGTSFLVPEDVLHDIDILSTFLSDRKIVYVATIASVAAMLAARWNGGGKKKA